MIDLHTKVDVASLILTPEERLRARVHERYYRLSMQEVKTASGPPPFGNDDPAGNPEPEGTPVMGASALPGGDRGGPGKRNIPKDHPYDPRALKPLSRMLWAMSVALGHALTAYRQFTRLKSSTISPDGMLGGRGYVMQVKEIRDKLHDACENLSAISDSIHDEINAPHWEPKLNQLDPADAMDVKKFLQESQQILQDPEAEAEGDMEAIEDAAADAATEEGADLEAPGEGQPEEVPLGEEEAPLGEEEEETLLGEGEGEEEAALGEVPEGEEEAPLDEEGEAPLEEEEAPLDEEVPPEEEAPPEEGEEASPEEESYSREEPTEEEDSENPFETFEEGEEEVPEEAPPEGEEEAPEAPEEGEEVPPEEDEEEVPPEEEEIPEGEEDKPPVEFDEEDEATAEQALESSGLPGSEEPRPEPLGKPKKKLKKPKKKLKFAPEMVQDQKFSPEMQAKQASYSYFRGNSSVSPDSLPGPRVDHLDRAEDRGPLDSYNEDEPRVTDEWGLSDGGEDDYIYRTPWENDTREAGGGDWPGSMKFPPLDTQRPSAGPPVSLDTYRTIAELVEKGWSEDRILKSPMGRRLRLDKSDIHDAILMKKRNLLARKATSGLPEDTDPPADAWDFGLGYGAEGGAGGEGAGGYGNPSGEGSGTKGVYGPTSGLPSDPGGFTEDTTPSVDVSLNERTNVRSQNSVMPTDVEEPVARSDYYTDGLSDEMIAQSELPADPVNPYNYDRDLPNKSEMYEHHDTPYIRYDYTTHNYRPDPNYSRPER